VGAQVRLLALDGRLGQALVRSANGPWLATSKAFGGR